MSNVKHGLVLDILAIQKIGGWYLSCDDVTGR